MPSTRLNFVKKPGAHLLCAVVKYGLLKAVAYCSKPFDPAS